MLLLVSLLVSAGSPQLDAEVEDPAFGLSVRVGGGYSAPATDRIDRVSGAGRRALDVAVAASLLELSGFDLALEAQLVQGLPDDDAELSLLLSELRLRAVLRAQEVLWRPMSLYGGVGLMGARMRMSSTDGDLSGNEWVPGGLAVFGVRFDASPRSPLGLFAYVEYGYALRAERALRLEGEDAEPVPLGRVDFSGHVVSAGVGVRF